SPPGPIRNADAENVRVMPRLACLYVPMFPLAARLRSEPDLRDTALAIVEGAANNAHIVAASRRARTKGVHAGLSITQARSLVPKLIARNRDAECEQTAQEALLEVAETFSPRIEDAGEGVVYFDITGMERHFADDGEREMASGERGETGSAAASSRAPRAATRSPEPAASRPARSP